MGLAVMGLQSTWVPNREWQPLELGVVGAVKEHPKMANLQEVLVHLYDQYHFSPKAIRELHEIAEALEEKVLRPTTLCGARWLSIVARWLSIVP